MLDGDEVVSQAMACQQYLAEKWGLVGGNASLTLQLLAEMKLEGNQGSLYTLEDKADLTRLLNRTQNAKFFAKLEGFFTLNAAAGKPGPFILGTAEPTCADFVLWEKLDVLFEMAKYVPPLLPLLLLLRPLLPRPPLCPYCTGATTRDCYSATATRSLRRRLTPPLPLLSLQVQRRQKGASHGAPLHRAQGHVRGHERHPVHRRVPRLRGREAPSQQQNRQLRRQP